jgi:hypothetical protein
VKLLLENWRKYLVEAQPDQGGRQQTRQDPAGNISPDQEQMMQDQELARQRHLAQKASEEKAKEEAAAKEAATAKRCDVKLSDLAIAAGRWNKAAGKKAKAAYGRERKGDIPGGITPFAHQHEKRVGLFWNILKFIGTMGADAALEKGVSTVTGAGEAILKWTQDQHKNPTLLADESILEDNHFADKLDLSPAFTAYIDEKTLEDTKASWYKHLKGAINKVAKEDPNLCMSDLNDPKILATMGLIDINIWIQKKLNLCLGEEEYEPFGTGKPVGGAKVDPDVPDPTTAAPLSSPQKFLDTGKLFRESRGNKMKPLMENWRRFIKEEKRSR